MKKGKIVFLLILLVCSVLVFNACTQQERVKRFGGSMDVELEQGKKLVNVTWKETEMWILVRDRKPDEQPESYKFYEQSAWGILQGTVKIKER